MKKNQKNSNDFCMPKSVELVNLKLKQPGFWSYEMKGQQFHQYQQNELPPLTLNQKDHDILPIEILVLAWSRHTNVAELKRCYCMSYWNK